MGTEVSNIASDILSACVSSAKAGDIYLHEPYKPAPHKVHGQLHAMLLMPPGGHKSSLLSNISDKYKHEGEKFTGPGILGTIKKSGDFVPGAVTYAAGKCLVIDEFHSLNDDALRGLLKLTEQQRYRLTLGWNVLRPAKYNRKYIKYIAKDNYLWIKHAKFSCLLSGIFARNKRIDDQAFSSRFMPIKFDFNIDEAVSMALGKTYFDVNIKTYEEDIHFEDYEKFVRIYASMVKELPEKIKSKYCAFSGLFMRNVLQFSRLFSWASQGNSTIDDWERYIPFMPLLPYNCIASTLTLSEFEIYSMLKEEKKQREIAIKLNVSEAYISKVINRLRRLGLG